MNRPFAGSLDHCGQLQDKGAGQLQFRSADCRRPESVTTSWICNSVGLIDTYVRSTGSFSLAPVRQGKELRLRLCPPLSALVERSGRLIRF
jgi:hypothetical protein